MEANVGSFHFGNNDNNSMTTDYKIQVQYLVVPENSILPPTEGIDWKFQGGGRLNFEDPKAKLEFPERWGFIERQVPSLSGEGACIFSGITRRKNVACL